MSFSEIVCGEKLQRLELDASLGSADHLAISLEPYIGRLDIHLELAACDQVKVLGSYLTADTHVQPFFADHCRDVPESCSFLLLKRAQDYLGFLCLSHHDQSCSLRGDANGLILLADSGKSREANETRRSLLCCRGTDLDRLIHELFTEALRVPGGMGRLLEKKPPLPLWLGSLGWESDQLLEDDCNEERIVDCVESLVRADIPLRYVVINEGWQQLAPNRQAVDPLPSLLSFQADLERFPNGLYGLIEKIKSMGVEHVGVWHAMMGHRGGIHPRLAQSYDLPPDPQGRYFLGYDLGHTFQFYYDYYAFLREQGVTFIRVGDQNSTQHYCREGMSLTSLYKNLQIAMQAAASIQFNNVHFNSGCLRNENLFYWTTSRIARAADGRDPDSSRSTSRQIRDNLCNSLWLQHLMRPDLSPWSTQEPSAETMAAFHAVTGGFTAINDLHGMHDGELLHKLCLPSGKLLQADQPLRVSDSCLFSDPLSSGQIHIAYTKKNLSTIFLLLNLGDTFVQESLHLPELARGSYALYSSKRAFLGFSSLTEAIEVSLAPGEAEILTISPVTNGAAILGCPGFFLLPGPIQHSHWGPDSLHIHSLCTSPLLITSERQILEARRNNEVVPWDYDSEMQLLLLDPYSSTMERETFYTVVFDS